MSLPPLIEALCRSETYPHRPKTLELMQTHISYVFLGGDQVYKVKKPVCFSFLDFSTLERRRHFCHEEVRLNRRLAGDVYLGVVAICPATGAALKPVTDSGRELFRIGEEDDPSAVEYAVHMRRLPHDRTLDQLLIRDLVTVEMIEALVERVVDFHRSAATSEVITANGAPAAVWRVLSDNYANAEAFRGITVDAADDEAIRSFARAFLDCNEELLRRRQLEGRIRECHGDLHTDHIYFTERLVIVDCVEFNPLFRYCDVASDLAFLAMDLDFHQRPELTKWVVEHYVARSNDRELPTLLPFYQCYRAYVRGKVDSLKSIEPELDADEQKQAADSARRHFDLAYRYTWSASRPVLILVAGLSGTGKSAIAAALHTRTGLAVLSSDIVRKALAAPAAPVEGKSDYESGLYDPAHTQRTYATLLQRARILLATGNGVILDATFQRRSDREAACQLAARDGVSLLLVECRCAEDIVRQRLRARSARGDSISDADCGIYQEQLRCWEAIADGEATTHLILDTDAPPVSLARKVEEALRALTQAT